MQEAVGGYAEMAVVLHRSEAYLNDTGMIPL